MLKWKRIYDGCWHGFVNNSVNPTIILEQSYSGRKLWNIEHVGHGSVIDGGCDCFSFRNAKIIARVHVKRLETSKSEKTVDCALQS